MLLKTPWNPKIDVAKVNECYSHINTFLAPYEDATYRGKSTVFYSPKSIDLKNYLDCGKKAVRNLVNLYIPEYWQKEAFEFVWKKYLDGWERYLKEKENMKEIWDGMVKYNVPDYRSANYSWRGMGPKPYFENIISQFIELFANKKYRSIDDEYGAP